MANLARSIRDGATYNEMVAQFGLKPEQLDRALIRLVETGHVSADETLSLYTLRTEPRIQPAPLPDPAPQPEPAPRTQQQPQHDTQVLIDASMFVGAFLIVSGGMVSILGTPNLSVSAGWTYLSFVIVISITVASAFCRAVRRTHHQETTTAQAPPSTNGAQQG